MSSGPEADVRQRIAALVDSILAQNESATQVAPDTRLADAGMTSMDMVNLMLGIESEFDIALPQADITPDNFQTIETIERLVLKRKYATAA